MRDRELLCILAVLAGGTHTPQSAVDRAQAILTEVDLRLKEKTDQGGGGE